MATNLSFKNNEEFMAVQQFTKRPHILVSHPFQCLKWLCMIYEKAGINTRNNISIILKIKETSVDFRVLDIVYWRRFHDSFSMFLDEAKLESVK